MLKNPKLVGKEVSSYFASLTEEDVIHQSAIITSSHPSSFSSTVGHSSTAAMTTSPRSLEHAGFFSASLTASHLPHIDSSEASMSSSPPPDVGVSETDEMQHGSSETTEKSSQILPTTTAMKKS